VTAALEAAVTADPRNPALRIHLASLLLIGGDATRALTHAQAALGTRPDDTEALVIARDAAQATGERGLADTYTRLLGLSPTLLQPPDDGDRADRGGIRTQRGGSPMGPGDRVRGQRDPV
jgi:Flp pilus assembly protein TadD